MKHALQRWAEGMCLGATLPHSLLAAFIDTIHAVAMVVLIAHQQRIGCSSTNHIAVTTHFLYLAQAYAAASSLVVLLGLMHLLVSFQNNEGAGTTWSP